jgi:hypothetical protein
MNTAAPVKDQHAAIRNMFAGGNAASTNSPISFMEKTSTNLEKLLNEEMQNNESLRRVLSINTKLLKDIKKERGSGLSFSDLILSRYVGNIFSGALRLTGVGLAAVMSGSFLRSGISTFTKGAGGLLKWFFRGALGGIASSLKLGMGLVARAGKPLVNLTSGIMSFFKSGGFLSKMGDVFKSASGLLPILKGGAGFATKIFSKLLWPITAVFAMYEAFNGYNNADSILGKPIDSKLKRMQVGLTEVVNGLLFGLPNMVAQYFGASSFSSAVDNGIQRLGVIVTEELPAFFKEKIHNLLTWLRTKWEEIDVGEALSGFKDFIKNGLISLGARLSTAFGSMFDYLLGKPTYYNTAPALNYGKSKEQYGPAYNRPKLSMTPSSVREDSYKGSSATLRNYMTEPGSILPARVIMDMSAATAESLLQREATETRNLNSVSEGMSTKEKSWFKAGLDAMKDAGTTVATSTAAGLSSTMSGLSEALPEGLTGVFKEAVEGSWTSELKAMLYKIPELLKQQAETVLNPTNMDTVTNILTGKAPSFDMSGAVQGIGAPVTTTERMPGMADGTVPVETPNVGGVKRKDIRPSTGYPVNPGKSLGDAIQMPGAYGPKGGPSNGKFSYAPQFRGDGVDKRMINVFETAAGRLPEGYTIEAFSGDRHGGKGNHKDGHAMDFNLFKDGKLVKQPYASPGGKGSWVKGVNGGFTENFREYEKVAQEMKKVQMELYPDMPFRWGGYFGGSNPNDTMHVDNTPGGATSQGSWETGLYNKNHPFSRGSHSEGMGKDYAGGGFTKADHAVAQAKYSKTKTSTPEPSVAETGKKGRSWFEINGSMPTPTSSSDFGKPKIADQAYMPSALDSIRYGSKGSVTSELPINTSNRVNARVEATTIPTQKSQNKTPAKGMEPVNVGDSIGKAIVSNTAKKANVIPNNQETASLDSIPTSDKKSMLLINSDALQ